MNKPTRGVNHLSGRACIAVCGLALTLASTASGQVIAWESNFDSTTDWATRNGVSGSVVAAPGGFTDGSGNVLELTLDSPTGGKFAEVNATNPSPAGMSLNIDIAALGVQAGDSFTMTYSFFIPTGQEFDDGIDKLGNSALRWNSTATPGFIPNNNQDSFPTSFLGGISQVAGTTVTRTHNGIVPFDTLGAGTSSPTHVFPLLGVNNDNNATTGTGAFGYLDNIKLSFVVVPEPSSFALLGLGLGALALRRRRH